VIAEIGAINRTPGLTPEQQKNAIDQVLANARSHLAYLGDLIGAAPDWDDMWDDFPEFSPEPEEDEEDEEDEEEEDDDPIYNPSRPPDGRPGWYWVEGGGFFGPRGHWRYRELHQGG
jgi:hypothetical protein